MLQWLGHLEESVLLIIMIVDKAYGFSVAQTYEQQNGNNISIPAIHTVLNRLDDVHSTSHRFIGHIFGHYKYSNY